MVKGNQKQLTNLGNDLSGQGDNASVISLSGSAGSVETHNTRLSNTTGFVMTTQATVPGGIPSVGHSTLWVKTSDGYAYLTDPTGTNRLFAGPQGPQGPQGPGAGATGTLAQVLNNGNTTDGYNIVIVQNDMITSYQGADITVRTSNSSGSGNLYLQTSASTYASGNIYLQAGNAGTIYNAGGINLTAGSATGTGIGGNATLYAGGSTSGAGGYSSIIAGQSGVGDGGFVSIYGGRSLSSGYGGDVKIKAGEGPSAIYGGNVIFYKPDGNETFHIDYLGYLTTTNNGDYIGLRPKGVLYLQTVENIGTNTGDIYIQSGSDNSTYTTGSITVRPGSSTNGQAGHAYLSGGGTSNGIGGSAFINGGSSVHGTGGIISILAGRSFDGYGGNVIIGANEGSTFTNGGEIIFNKPDGTESFHMDIYGYLTTDIGQSIGVRPKGVLYLQTVENIGTNTGDIYIQSGSDNSTYTTGSITIRPGSSTNGQAGHAYLSGGGTSNGIGGSAFINGGSSVHGTGGIISILAGRSFDGYGGNVVIGANEGSTFTNGGEIIFNKPDGAESFHMDIYGYLTTDIGQSIGVRPSKDLFLQNLESGGIIYVQSQYNLYLQANNGGDNYVYAGPNNAGIGGRLYLYGGDSTSSHGGQVYLVGGDGYLDGGAIELRGGVATDGEGGCASLIAGDGHSGGNVFIYGGNASGDSASSGNITLRAGTSHNTGTSAGSVGITGGAADLTGPTAMNGGNASVIGGQGAVGGIALLAGGMGGTTGGIGRVRSGYGNGCPGGDVEIIAAGDIADIYKPGSIKLISNITDSIVINQDGYITSQSGEFKTEITPDYARGYNYNNNIEKDIIPILKAEPRNTKMYFYEQVYMFEKSDGSPYDIDIDITGLGDGYSSMFIEYDVLSTPIGSSGAIYKKFIAGWVRTNNTLSSYGTAATITTINNVSDHWTIAQPAVPDNETLRITIDPDGGNYRFMVRAKLSLQHSFGN